MKRKRITEKSLVAWLKEKYPIVYEYDYAEYSDVTYCVYRGTISHTENVSWHYVILADRFRIWEHVRYSYAASKLNVKLTVKKRIDLLRGNNLAPRDNWK